MTQPTETPRCREMMYEPPVTKPGPYTGELRRCNLPLDTPTGGPCVTCGGDDNMMIHSTYWAEGRPPGHSGHPYISPLGCSIHGAATDKGAA